MYRIFILLGVLLFAGGGRAIAGVETDQAQPLIDAEAGLIGIGGDDQQKLAQSFTIGVHGEFVGLRLPITSCGNGELKISLLSLRDGRPDNMVVVRSRNFTVEEVGFREAGTFQDFLFAGGVTVAAGDKFAFILETVGADSHCSISTGPIGNPYAEGNGFFDNNANPPGWVANKEFPGTAQDLPFYTLMDAPDVAGPDQCVAANGQRLPIQHFVPGCRCFEDPGAMEMRCGIHHPDFFISTRIPMPLPAAEPFERVWDFTPLTELDGPVRVHLTGGGLTSKGQAWLFGAKGDKGGVERKTIKAMAPKAGEVASGIAVISYEMKDAKSVYFKKFGVDISVTAVQKGAANGQLVPKVGERKLPGLLPKDGLQKLPDLLADEQ